MKRAIDACLIALLSLGACVQERTVTIEFSEVGDGTAGFRCRTSDGTSALAQRVGRTGGEFSLVIDFLSLGPVLPGCRPSQLLNHCKAAGCQTVMRRCVAAHVDLQSAGSFEERARMALSDVAGLEITDDAPDGAVLIRVVASIQPCGDLTGGASPDERPFDAGQLIGCAHSCPVILDAAPETVLVDLSTLSRDCESDVVACASSGLSPE